MCDTIMMTNKFEMKEIKQWNFEYTYEIEEEEKKEEDKDHKSRWESPSSVIFPFGEWVTMNLTNFLGLTNQKKNYPKVTCKTQSEDKSCMT